MKYIGDPADESTWLAPNQIRNLLPKSNWRHDRLLEEVDDAVQMGLMPSQFWQASREDQAWIIARYRVIRLMEAYENHLAKRKTPT